MTKLTDQQLDRIDYLVSKYQAEIEKGEDPYAKYGQLKDCRIHHTRMAAGGNGGPTGYDDGSTIRETYYPRTPDVFFQRVCERMRWDWSGELKLAGWRYSC